LLFIVSLKELKGVTIASKCYQQQLGT